MAVPTTAGAIVTLGDLEEGPWLSIVQPREHYNDALSTYLTVDEAKRLGDWLVQYAAEHSDG